jgi:hypothetical protein
MCNVHVDWLECADECVYTEGPTRIIKRRELCTAARITVSVKRASVRVALVRARYGYINES